MAENKRPPRQCKNCDWWFAGEMPPRRCQNPDSSFRGEVRQAEHTCSKWEAIGSGARKALLTP